MIQMVEIPGSVDVEVRVFGQGFPGHSLLEFGCLLRTSFRDGQLHSNLGSNPALIGASMIQQGVEGKIDKLAKAQHATCRWPGGSNFFSSFAAPGRKEYITTIKLL